MIRHNEGFQGMRILKFHREFRERNFELFFTMENLVFHVRRISMIIEGRRSSSEDSSRVL